MASISLNPEQMAAVHHEKGPLLILAGAGSGKTRVIVNRIVHLLKNGVNPYNILAVSFTNKAVKEMAERVTEMIKSPERVRKLTLCTFHSLGVRILRQGIDLLDYPRKFTIYDPADQLAMIRNVMRLKKIDEKQYDPKSFLYAISDAKNAFQEPETIKDVMLREVFLAYDEGLRACGAVDFDDLIRLPVLLMRKFPSVRQKWASRYEQIMVDEYQDTNQAQFLMVKELASVHNNICVVGDDDQSIYGWRGSNVENIRQFHKHFEGTSIIKLTQNYRCSGNILKAANKVIERSEGRYSKELWTEQDDGELIGMAVLENELEEAKFVVQSIQKLRYFEHRPYSDFAIMYRTNAQSRPFEEALRKEKIPYRLIGGTKFFDRKEIRDILAYLKVFHQPKDEISLRRILNYPPRGIGTTTVDKISKYARSHDIPFIQSCREIEQNDEIASAPKKRVLEFVALLDSYARRFKTGGNLHEIVKELLEEIQFSSTLYKEYKEIREAQKKLENIEALVESIVQYQEEAARPTLAGYLDQVSLDTTGEDDSQEDENARPSVTLITLHGAKGLEFPIVYLVGMEEGFLPYYRREESETDLEEERRLCYVGITRAKEKLFLSRALERRRLGNTELREPSRFLGDIPKSLFKMMGLLADPKDKLSPEELDEKVNEFFKNILG